MKPIAFQYERPGNLAGALETLARFGSFARPLAGGQSLVPMLNMRLVQPAVVVDLNGLDAELGGVAAHGDGLEIGALTRYSELEASALVAERLPLLRELIGHIGDRQVRNRGTLGGSLSQADPTGEMPLAVTTLDATVVVAGPGGSRREVFGGEFFAGSYAPALSEGELVVAVRFPVGPGVHAFTETGRKHNDFATISILVAAEPEGGSFGEVRIGLGGLGDTPLRATAAERLLGGREWTDSLIEDAAAAAGESIDPPSDVRASAEYRRHVLPVKLGRLLRGLRDAR